MFFNSFLDIISDFNDLDAVLFTDEIVDILEEKLSVDLNIMETDYGTDYFFSSYPIKEHIQIFDTPEYTEIEYCFKSDYDHRNTEAEDITITVFDRNILSDDREDFNVDGIDKYISLLINFDDIPHMKQIYEDHFED